MDIPNIGFLFYKDYYEKYYDDYDMYKNNEENTSKYFEEKNKKILKDISVNVKNCEAIGKNNLYFKTTYPGLLIGSGNTHEIGEKNEFKIGFQFDYTTGLPIIPGSSVKGVLRSVFQREGGYEYLKEVFKENKKIFNNIDIEGLKFEELEKEIFEGMNKDGNLSIYERDIFFDAVVDFEKTKQVNNKEQLPILGEDFITPHKDPLKNPIPLKFLKIKANVIWNFQFDLKGEGLLNKEQKLFLFRQILLDMGVGAKTNVGYGRFDDSYGYKELVEELKKEEIEKENRRKEEENKKIENLSEIERKLYFLEKEMGKSNYDNLVMDLYNEIDTFSNSIDKKKAAIFLKEQWIETGKWTSSKDGKINKISKKQTQKINKIKEILQ